jgi:RimJ/RimL family protein N-acetyltransferase
MEIALAACVLRGWRASDESTLAHHANNPNVADNLRDIFPQPYSPADARHWIKRNAGVSPQTQFAIVVDGAAVGGIGVTILTDIFRRSAEIGYWLGEKYWGQGIMSEAVPAVTRYAFETFDLARVFAYVFASNPASARVLEKAGFALEGRLRNHVTKNAVTMDELVYGILASNDCGSVSAKETTS